jgi:hypothetical protein
MCIKYFESEDSRVEDNGNVQETLSCPACGERELRRAFIVNRRTDKVSFLDEYWCDNAGCQMVFNKSEIMA